MPWAMRSPNGLAAAQRGSQCCGCQSPVSAQKPMTSASLTVRAARAKALARPTAARTGSDQSIACSVARVGPACVLHGSHLLQGDVRCGSCARARTPTGPRATRRCARACAPARSPRRRSPRRSRARRRGARRRRRARACAARWAGSPAAAISRRLTIATACSAPITPSSAPRPREHHVRPQRLRVHRDERAAEGLAQHHRHARDACSPRTRARASRRA